MDIFLFLILDLIFFQIFIFFKGILISFSFVVYLLVVSYNFDSEFLYSVSESDSVSDCGSDVLFELGIQVCVFCK